MNATETLERLAEHVRSHQDFSEAHHCYVSIYRHHRCFGGHEEGGWWYDVHELEGSIPFATREDAERWLEVAKAQVAEQNEAEAPSRWRAMENLPDEDQEPCPANCPEGYIPTGWDDGGELNVVIEDCRGQLDNSREPAPHYE